jgi:DNA-binding CsgD family transcriptional regulator
MAMVGMSVAQLLLGPHDAVWYLYSDDALRQSGRMVPAAGDRAQLVAVPLPQASLASPQFTPAAQAPTRAAALTAVEAQRARQAYYVVESLLTPAERALAVLVAGEVLTVDEMAARLHKSPKTITNQLTTIYSKLESAFGLQPDTGVKREFLRQELGPYLAAHPAPR